MRRAGQMLALCLTLLPMPALPQSLVPILRDDGGAPPPPIIPIEPQLRLQTSPAPAPAAPEQPPDAGPGSGAVLVPRLRPDGLRVPTAQIGAQAAAGASTANLQPRPEGESAGRVSGFLSLLTSPSRRKNMVCGDVDLQGEVVGPVPSKTPGCGIPEAVRLTSVAGVALSTPALLNCDAARALKTWVRKGAIPAARRLGGLEEMRVASSYSCRTRNNIKGAKLSEHAKGNAIDISAFRTRNGQTITVLSGWSGGQTRRMLQEMWKAACGPFGTVLGPNADRYHRDHFHFDINVSRRGPYCR